MAEHARPSGPVTTNRALRRENQQLRDVLARYREALVRADAILMAIGAATKLYERC
jgi:hypothetical protein